ncbi:hypothetical protein ABLE68_10500 [Nocardioides sp. CN2-186]|uniref:hypothetical protein n=1 Tax=Nocardioides tweenelious TaxID=3156607 RepID=UPI0032B463D3
MSNWGVRRRLMSGLVVLAMVPVALATTPVEARPAARYPSPITAASATPGPGAGEVTIRWKSKGDDVDYWRIDTSTTPPKQDHADDPSRGWVTASFVVPGGSKARSMTLTPEQTAAAGAGLGTGNSLFVYVRGIHKKPKQVRSTKVFAASVLGTPSQATGASIRVASYNVRVYDLDGPTGPHSWKNRAPRIVKNVVDVAPDIAGLQEAIPPMLTEEYSKDPGAPVLMKLFPDRYRMVRTAPIHYKKPNLPMDARILYDSTKFTLVSDCDNAVEYGDPDDEKTCSIEIPTTQGKQQFAAYARFEVIDGPSAGQQFWFVTAHQSPGSNRAAEVLRAKQTEEIAQVMDAKNSGLDLPIIFTADTNSYQASPDGNDARVRMLQHGYYDTASAVQTVNLRFNSTNHFVKPQDASANGFGTRLDVVMTKNLPGADLFKIVRTDNDPDFDDYPSDHNLVFAEFRLPMS